jgi:hypothetical protein
MEGQSRGSTLSSSMPLWPTDAVDSSCSSSSSNNNNNNQQPMIGASGVQEPSISRALLSSQASSCEHTVMTNPSHTTTPNRTSSRSKPRNEMRYRPLPRKEQETKTDSTDCTTTTTTATTTMTPKAEQALSHAPSHEPPCHTPPVTPATSGTEKDIGRRTTLVRPDTFEATSIRIDESQRQPQRLPSVVAEPIANVALHSPPSPDETCKCFVIMLCMMLF